LVQLEQRTTRSLYRSGAGLSKDKGIPDGYKGKAEGNIQPWMNKGLLERRKTVKSEEECFSPAEVVVTGREENQISKYFQQGKQNT